MSGIQNAKRESAPADVQVPKVLHVLEATLGGTLRFMEDVIECSKEMRFSMGWAYAVERAGAGFPAVLDRALASGWAAFPLNMTRAVKPMADLRAALALRQLILTYRPDIIHCHSSKAGAVGRIAIMGLRTPPKLIYMPHALAIHIGRRYLLIERALSGWTDRFAGVSEGECKEIVTHKLTSIERTSVIYPAIDTTYFSPRDQGDMRGQLDIPLVIPVLLSVGRLTEQKDPMGFVEVARRLLSGHPGLRAIWVGDGELRRDVERAIARMGLEDCVSIAGWQADVRPYLGACNVLLSTSRYESFGYMTGEALSMQKPVVGTRVNGTTDIMSGELAPLLYEPGDYANAAALASLILKSPSLEQRFGTTGRHTICQNFSRLKMREALQACYEKVLCQ